MHDASACSSCAGCGGASAQGAHSCEGCGTLLLCEEEIQLLSLLGQYAFLPLWYRAPQTWLPLAGCPGSELTPYSAVVASLIAKKLISPGYDLPLPGTSYGTPEQPTDKPASIALTALGQESVNWLALYYVPPAPAE